MRVYSSPALSACLLVAGFAVYSYAQDQSTNPPRLSARQVYYSAEQTTVTPGAATAGPPAPEPAHHGQVKPAKRPLKPTSSSQSAATKAGSGSAEDSRLQATAAASSGSEVQTSSAYHSGGNVQLAVASDKQYPPLGLKYSVYRVSMGGAKEPVDADTVFHSNDHIEFTVEVNSPGYLYVVSRGSSGKWSTLFPASDEAATPIQPRQSYSFPPGGVITFADPAGKEELFLFLSRQPVRSKEDLMLQMSNGQRGGNPVSAPSGGQQNPEENTIEAFNRMDDDGIGLLKTTYSRDLIVEKANGTASVPNASSSSEAPVKDNSVYVVNPSTGADSHVVADIAFRHE